MGARRHPDLTAALEALAAGDVKPILGIGIRSALRADEGVFCECAEPDLNDRDLMCGACLHRNQGQVARREALMRSPHPFEEREGKEGLIAEMCGLCAGWRNDERHAVVGPHGR